MTLDEARTKVATLKPGALFTLGGRALEVTSADCGCIEAVPPEHRDITGAYARFPMTALAEAAARGEATL